MRFCRASVCTEATITSAVTSLSDALTLPTFRWGAIECSLEIVWSASSSRWTRMSCLPLPVAANSLTRWLKITVLPSPVASTAAGRWISVHEVNRASIASR